MMKRKNFFTCAVLRTAALTFLSFHLTACNGSGQNTGVPSENPPLADTTPPITEQVSAPIPDSDKAPDSGIHFSAKAGFYDTAFLLELSVDDDKAIYFTLDGSDPRTSDSAMLYTDGIFLFDNTDKPNVYSAVTDISLSGYQPPQFNVDKGMIIRAVAKTPEGAYGAVATNSYFIGKTASYYSDMKAISMVTDSDFLFDPDTGAYMIGSKYYEWLESDEYVAYDPGDVANVTNYNTSGRESEFPVSIQVFEDGTAAYTADVGARISGNWSRSSAQKSFRFYARKEYGSSKMEYAFFDELTDSNGDRITKFDKFTLRNAGNDYQGLHFRDAFIHDLAKDLAVDSMASEPCILFVNGEFWGFYMLREKPEGYYIQSHYGIDEKEVAVIKNGELDSGTEADLGEYWDFCRWAATADMTADENYKEFCNRMDLQSFMDYMTVETYVNNNDWANGYMNNWMVWRSKTVNPELPKADGKWRFILYDLDMCAGLYGSTETSYRYDSLNGIHSDGPDYNLPAILNNLSRNEEFLQAFYDNYIRIIDTCFAPETVSAKLDTYVNAYGEAAKATFFRFGIDWAAYNYESETENVRNFFHRRPEYAKRYLNTFCGIETELTETASDNLLPTTSEWNYYGPASVYADPQEHSLQVNVPEKTQDIWGIQSQAKILTLEKGCEYKLTFEASSTSSASLDIGINRYDGSGYPSCWWTNTTLSDEMRYYEFYFTMESNTHSDWQLCFNYGHGTGDFIIKNASLTKVAD